MIFRVLSPLHAAGSVHRDGSSLSDGLAALRAEGSGNALSLGGVDIDAVSYDVLIGEGKDRP